MNESNSDIISQPGYEPIILEPASGKDIRIVRTLGCCAILRTPPVNLSKLFNLSDSSVLQHLNAGFTENIKKEDPAYIKLNSLKTENFLEQIPLGVPLNLIPDEIIVNTVKDLPENYLVPLSTVINTGFDPTLLPEVLSGYSRTHSAYNPKMTEAVAEILGKEDKLTQIFVGFLDRTKDPDKANPAYTPPDYQNQLNGFLTDFKSALSGLPGINPNQAAEITGYIEDLSKSELPDPGFNRLRQSLYEQTNIKYFKDANALRNASSLKDYLVQYRQAQETAKYMVNLYRLSTEFFRRYLPDLYNNIGVAELRVTQTNQYQEPASDGAVKIGDKNQTILVLKSKTGFGHTASEIPDEETAFIGMEKVPRRIGDFLKMIHEIGHASFDRIIQSEAGQKFAEDDPVFSAFTEGYALLCEKLATGILIDHPQIINLKPGDIEILQKVNSHRLDLLKNRNDEYTEGAFKIMYKIFYQTAFTGDKTQRWDYQKGMDAVKQFTDGLDYAKLRNLSRNNPHYLKLLQSAGFDELKRLLGK